MTNVSTFGKYRHRDEDGIIESSSALVALEEGKTISSTLLSGSGINAYNLGVPPKPPRRSSIQIGVLPNSERNNNSTNGKEVNNKRRSSISILLRRHNEKKESLNLSMESNENENGDENSSGGSGQEHRHRRLSLHEKFRRRKKGQILGSPLNESLMNHLEVDQTGDGTQCYGSSDDIDVYKLHYIRQKRPSWWNIFIPDNHKPRSRRSSQDVATLSLNTNRTAKGGRSKSRSVDHGLEPPFDVTSLRAKIDKNYDSNDQLSRDGSSKTSSITSIPTTTYIVDNRDTLTAVAARYNTTPSELTHINRLGSSFIYPGQILLVPAPSESIQSSSTTLSTTKIKSSKDDLHTSDKDILDGLRPNSPKPGHIERISSPNIKNDDDPVVIQRFLKINVRHITDGQGVVGGVLLVTPNAVMFDPNVSDPLVIEHGPESYGVIAPMELVVNAAIFQDIAHMRVGGGSENKTTETPDVYYPKNCNRYENTHSPGKDSLLVKDETFPELRLGSIEGCDDQESVCSSNEREGDAFPKAFDRDLVTPTNLQKSHDEQLSTESSDSMTDKCKEKTSYEKTSTSIETIDPKTVIQTSNKTVGATEIAEIEERKPSAGNKITLIDQQWPLPIKESLVDKNLDVDKKLLLAAPIPQIVPQIPSDEISQLIKLSCHDSGIDIRDPNAANIQPIQAKKIYTDSDVVLSSDWIPPLTVASTYFSDSPPKHIMSIAQTVTQTNVVEGGRKKTASVSFSVEDNECPKSGSLDKMVDSKKNKMLKRLSYPLAWVEGLTGETTKSDSTESAPSTGDSSQSVFSKVFSRRSSIGTFIRPHSTDSTHSANRPRTSAPKSSIDYRSMVSVDDMPELFVSFDKLIPRPARACPDPPLYLRLRMGRPTGKLQTLPTSVMSYGKNKVRPEYWFSIPKNRVDELYRFLSCWVPHLYGELDEEAINNRGFELIQHDTEWTNGEENKTNTSSTDGDLTDLSRESWEALSLSTDDYRKATLFATGSFDQEFTIPELVGVTEILTEEHREKLCSHLPARAEGYAWSLIFSTSQHGFSLNTLYRKMQKLETPVLIVIQDTDNNVFGALTSCSLRVSDHFYGTGESLLYKFNPTFKVFHWSGENLYFIKGNQESLAIGSGDGKFGLWLDGDLNQGRSQDCRTYSNEPLAPQEDFVVKTLECWAFV